MVRDFCSSSSKRWTCLIAAIWLQSVNGTNMNFAVYSSALKAVLNINQTKLNSLAVASDLGKTLGWLSGITCNHFPTWVVLTVASILGFLGYGFQWLVLNQFITRISYWQVYIASAMAGNSICWFNTVCFREAVTNFGRTRGMATGLITSYVGLSTVIYTCLSYLLSHSNSSSNKDMTSFATASMYPLLNSLVPAMVASVAALMLKLCGHEGNPPPADTDAEDLDYSSSSSEKRNMIVLTVIAVLTAAFSILYEFLPHGTRKVQALYTTALLFLLVGLPLCVLARMVLLQRTTTTRVGNACTPSSSPTASPCRGTSRKSLHLQIEEEPKRDEEEEEKNENEDEHKEATATESEGKKQEEATVGKPKLGEEHSIKDLMLSLDFWLYYMLYLCGATVGMVYMNNLGQIVQSLGYSKTPILASLVSSFGFFGRLAAGLPDYFQGKTRIPRPAWMGIWTLPLAGAFTALATLDHKTQPPHMQVLLLWGSTAVVGACTGAVSTISVAVSAELFGPRSFGVNHNILVTNIALGSALFGNVAAVLYDDHEQQQQQHVLPRSAKANADFKAKAVCMGGGCYHLTFLTWAIVCCVAVAMALALSLRTRALYRRNGNEQRPPQQQ